MLHDLTLGHLDPEAVMTRHRVVLNPLVMDTVRRLLTELGSTDAAGHPTSGGAGLRFGQDYVVIPWLGGSRNRISEEFAPRLHLATGCLIADLEHCWVVWVERLLGLSERASRSRTVQAPIR